MNSKSILFRVDDAVSRDKDLPMRRSFSVEDLLDEVEKIGNVSTGENKVSGLHIVGISSQSTGVQFGKLACQHV